MLERVQKILANAGVDSRRRCEDLIKNNRVKVNNKIIKLGDKADPEKDIITVDDKRIKFRSPEYILFYKPKNCICAVSDSRHKTVLDYVKKDVFPIGRLDKDTEGLLLLTNDGGFANRVIHPRHSTDKVYVVMLDRNFVSEKRLSKGVFMEGKLVTPKYIKTLSRRRVELCIHSGFKHVVKKLFNKLGYNVVELKRIRLGNLTLKGLKPGRYRNLTKKEVEQFVV